MKYIDKSCKEFDENIGEKIRPVLSDRFEKSSEDLIELLELML